MDDIFAMANMAIQSGLYTDMPISAWVRHFKSFSQHGHLEVIKKNGEVICWATWIKTDKPHGKIPKFFNNIDKGKHLKIIAAQVKKGENGCKLLRQIRNVLIKKNPGCEYFFWYRTKTKYKPKIFKIKQEV